MRFIFTDPFRLISAATMGAFFGLLSWSAYAVFVSNHPAIYAENGLLENAQAILGAIACLVFLASTALEKRSDKLILLSCSLLCSSFVLREVDVDQLAVHDALMLLGSGGGP
jgi:hypothetical protein